LFGLWVDSTDGDGGFSGTKRNIVIVILALFIGLLLAGLSLKLHLRKKKKKKSQMRIEGIGMSFLGSFFDFKGTKRTNSQLRLFTSCRKYNTQHWTRLY